MLLGIELLRGFVDTRKSIGLDDGPESPLREIWLALNCEHIV